MAKMLFDIDDARAIITISGEIEPGDAERFCGLVEDIVEKYQEPEVPIAIVAALDSPGGDYLEGIALGNIFWRNGHATLVRAGTKCYSAAAVAFLGGAYLGTVGGWGPDRTVELGGTVGFHSFSSESSKTVSLKYGIERGKALTMILTDYATALRIDMDFILESLKKRRDELLKLQTVGQFRQLRIKLRGATRTSRLTDEGAVNAANFATAWKRPVSLRPGNGETLAGVRHLLPYEYRRIVLRKLIGDQAERGPIAELALRALDGDGSDADAIYRDLERLNALPHLWLSENDRVVHVTGFDYGALFYVTDCFIKPSNEGTSNLALTAIAVHAPNRFEVVHYSHCGDCLYEVCRPDQRLQTE